MREKANGILIIRAVKFLNVLLVTLPFTYAWIFYYSRVRANEPLLIETILITVLFSIIYIIYGRIYDSFQISLVKIQELIYSQMLAELITDSIMFIVLWLVLRSLPDVVALLIVFFIQILISILWSVLANKWYFKHYSPKESIIIYDSRDGLATLIREYEEDKKFKIKKSYHVDQILSCLDQLQYSEVVFLSGVHSHERNLILKYCVTQSITTYIIPRVGDVIMSGSHRMHMLHLPILQVGRYSPTPEYLFIKRFFDIVVSFVCLVVLSPIFLLTALAVKSDGGPAFYKQERLTKDGKKFNVLKFRSMRVDAEKDGIARLSSGETDPRITKVGKFIRMVRLDEIPQLLNILKGEMSIVGPRPERPSIAEQYEKEIPEFGLRLQAKAGLTGYAQVYGKYNTTPYDKLLMDLMYISKPSLIEDLRICFATIKILFMKDSTEGIESGKITANS